MCGLEPISTEPSRNGTSKADFVVNDAPERAWARIRIYAYDVPELRPLALCSIQIMAACDHTSWVQLSGYQCNSSVIDPHRLQSLVDSLPDPQKQTPSVVFFFGHRTKDQALRCLFPHNNIRRGKSHGLARIYIDNSTEGAQNPLFFADADLQMAILKSNRAATCHQETVTPVAWQTSDIRSVADHILSRVLLASTNLLVLFADDFGEHLASDLARWINIGVSADMPIEVRPQLLLVMTKQTHENQQKIRQMYLALETETQNRIMNLFSSVSTQYLEDHPELSASARYRPLKERVLRQTDEIRSTLREHRWLFSASHLASLFQMRLRHVAAKVSESFSVIQQCRKYHRMPPDYVSHLEKVVEFGMQVHMQWESTTSYIASSILMDAYPPGAHLFDPRTLFLHVYADSCIEAFRHHYEQSFAEFLTKEVEKQLKRHFQYLESGKSTAAELHKENVLSKSRLWKQMASNSTCLYCLLRTPQHGLPCFHSICDHCACMFGTSTRTEEYHLNMSECFLCDSQIDRLIRIKPPTAGVRILSIDGGGTRGVIPIEFLRLLQGILGEDCLIQEFFDVAAGTSSGGLIVLIMFIYGWTPDECSETFDTLARKLFKRRRSQSSGLMSRIQQGLKCWMSDGQYDANELEAAMRYVFGDDVRMFGPTKSTSGTKVAVTASSISDASCFLFTNYNSHMTGRKSYGYSVIPHTLPSQEVRVWEAARATSAAPILFRPAQLALHGTFQDGGLKCNNPVNLAVSESRQMWAESNSPDLVLSLGTGTSVAKSPKAPHFRHILNDGFVPRLWRSFMSSLDGEGTWHELEDRLEEKSRRHYFRFNVSLGDSPSIDDLSCMARLRSSVHFAPDAAGTRIEMVSAMLTASFFFELDHAPRFEAGHFRCEGSIYCRNNSYGVIDVLSKTSGKNLEFTIGHEHLTSFGGVEAICPQCRRYRKRVGFWSEDLSTPITICLKSNKWPLRRISGFPQSLKWFVEQQRLDAAFGVPQHYRRATCKSCEYSSQKRKGLDLNICRLPKRSRPSIYK